MAVYTTVTDVELAQFAEGHGLGELHSFKGIAEGVENTNYLVETDRGRFILTLYEKRVDASDLPFFLGLMEHLASRGIACPLPVRDHSGAQITRLAGRPAAICTFLDGISVARPEVAHCALVGDALARLHVAGNGFTSRRANALGPAGWQPLFAGFAARADEIRPGLAGLIEDEIATIVPVWPAGLPEGVIHADLFPDNVFFLGGRLSGIIDFYFACNDILAYDIAVCLNAWCFGPDLGFDIDKARALFDGYRGVRPLLPAEQAAIPLLARGAALRFLLTRAHDWLTTPKDALVRPHDPTDYIRRLEWHRRAAGPQSYGAEEQTA
jgi:homoserine kinase type II